MAVLSGEVYTLRLQKLIYLCLTNTDKLTPVILVYLAFYGQYGLKIRITILSFVILS